MAFPFLLMSIPLLLAVGQTLAQSCFDFQGDAYVSFSSNTNFNNSGSAHYEMELHTTGANGIVMYSGRPDGDKEALFVSNGKLVYYLYNVASNGIGSQFGAFFVTTEDVNINEWVQVKVYRSWVIPARPPMKPRVVTGLVVTIDGNDHSHTDDQMRYGVNLTSAVYFGGYKDSLDDTIGYYTGKIRNIREDKNDLVFENPSLNYKGRVGLGCTESPSDV